jgi:Fe-S cluster assembly iron-binding protein IscA
MLTLTDAAKDAVKTMITAEEAPSGSGLRIAGEASSDGDAALSLEIAAGPAEGDAVVGDEGIRVFLDPTAAALLDDKVLDAEGHDDHFHFSIEEQ